jgi:hypothetical protein
MQIAIVLDLSDDEIHVLNDIARGEDEYPTRERPTRRSLVCKGLIRYPDHDGQPYLITEAGKEVLNRLFVLSPSTGPTLLELEEL